MGLDIGDARIGVALSDPLGLTAQPHSTIERAGGRSIQSIVSLIEKERVRTVVSGLPLELSGESGERALKVEDFVRQLRSAIERRADLKGVKVVLRDERFSTAEARRVVTGSGLKNKDQSAALDRVAAAVILDGYLHSSEHSPGG